MANSAVVNDSLGRFLDPHVLARIGNLELLSRSVVTGFINGLHRSANLGLSMDFAEHRGYMPGDDIRRVDWRLFARTDRFYIKEFEADTNSNFVTVLDVSSSMNYTGAGIRKIDYARYLAACLTYFVKGQRDRIGLVTFDSKVVDYVPPSARHLDTILHTLNRIEPGTGRKGDLKEPLHRAADRLRRKGMIVLISDLYEDPEKVIEAIKPLRGRGHELMVFQILDPNEINFPFENPSLFEDLESGTRLPISPAALRERYRESMNTHLSTLARLFRENHVEYALHNTAEPLDFALFDFLSARERMSKVR
ncbi:MAG: DUF58 domain-containing protein [Gemmatimonadota bacterium]|nr:DUF58 domain-containing protein [Gemmatimonadota bacterium]